MNKFIPLQVHNFILSCIDEGIKNNEKFILLLGKSGSGKSFLFEKIAEKNNFILFKEPFFDEESFLKSIAKHFLDKEIKVDFQSLIAIVKKSAKNKIVFMFDEAGMYEEDLLEKIRILGDLTQIHFILSLHKKQACLFQEYFASRISREIKIEKFSLEDIYLYVREKYNISLEIKYIKYISKLSTTNLRTLDKIFDTFLKLKQFYERENKTKDIKEILEMCALNHNLLGR